MNVPTKKDWILLANRITSELEDAEMDVIYISKNNNEIIKLKNAIDWSWETFTDADGQPKAVYWDNATKKEREMLDYFAKFEYAKRDVMKKLKQAQILIGECKEIMNRLVI